MGRRSFIGSVHDSAGVIKLVYRVDTAIEQESSMPARKKINFTISYRACDDFRIPRWHDGHGRRAGHRTIDDAVPALFSARFGMVSSCIFSESTSHLTRTIDNYYF